MDARGYRQCVPVNDDPDAADAAAARLRRRLRAALGRPAARRGTKAPWQLGMNYAHDLLTLRHGKLEDGAMQFTSPAAVVQDAAAATLAA